jgi:hypothetical protein
MASYVIIWENNTFGHQKVSGHTWPGHAAMNIGDSFDNGEVDPILNNYASWWPGEGADFSIGGIIKSLFTKSQKGDFNFSIIDDIESETYLPDHVIKLDTSRDQQMLMKSEWRSVFRKPGGASYKNLRKNCSTIVSRVLHAGGFLAQKWAVDNNWAWTPADVRALADASGGTHMTWVAFLAVLAQSNIAPDELGAATARSGRYCSTGAPCRFQTGEVWRPDGKKRK